MVLLPVSYLSESCDFGTPEIYSQVPEVGVCHRPLRLLYSVRHTFISRHQKSWCGTTDLGKPPYR